MGHNEMKKIIAVVGLLSLVSCTKKADEDHFVRNDDCGCSGRVSTTVKDMVARITANRGLLLRDAKQVAYGELIPCDTTKLSGLPTSKDGEYGYSVSGNLRPPCVTNGVTYFWSIELTSITKK